MTRRQTLAAAGAALVIAVGAGFGLGRLTGRDVPPASAPAESGRKVLYWYDPMVPVQHFERPGKSPYMDMQLVPKYADEGAGQAGVQVDPARLQSLGLRTARVERTVLASGVTAPGAIDFNERDVAVVQARAAGFVQRVYGRAPGDVIAAGAPLADLLVPEWSGAQGEFLAVLRAGDPQLVRAARQRLQLLGMPPALIADVERSGRVRNVVTVAAPSGGMIKTLGVRDGMSVVAGQTLAEVNGLAKVWLNAAVPEAMAGEVRLGEPVTATLAAFPGQAFAGRVSAVLPQADAQSRTLTVRIELPNRGLKLRPGMFANVAFGGATRPALSVPSEAVIRTGRRTLVMLAEPGGRFRPAEVAVGREAGGRTEVLSGLSEGEAVVASGQFLLDSEASLAGLQPRPATASTPGPAARVYQGRGRVEQVTPAAVTLSHGPIPAANWPAMTMSFRLADPALARGFKRGDQVDFTFDQPPEGPTVRRMTSAGPR